MNSREGEAKAGGRRDQILSDRLTVVLGYAELLLEETLHQLTAEQRLALFNVVVAAREIRDLLRQAPPPL